MASTDTRFQAARFWIGALALLALVVASSPSRAVGCSDAANGVAEAEFFDELEDGAEHVVAEAGRMARRAVIATRGSTELRLPARLATTAAPRAPPRK